MTIQWNDLTRYLSLPSIFRRAPQSKIAANQIQKSREQNELEVIAQKQKETMEKLRQNKISMKKALAGQSYMPCRSAVDNLTHPQEFHFATDDRLGPTTHNTHANAAEKGKNFVGTLRQHPPSPVSNQKEGIFSFLQRTGNFAFAVNLASNSQPNIPIPRVSQYFFY